MSGGGVRTALSEASTGAVPTLLRTLVNERHLRTPKAFRSQFLRAAAQLAVLESDREFAKLDVSDRQFSRWLDGARPRPYACRVLEHMFEMPVDELLRPAVLQADGKLLVAAAEAVTLPGDDPPLAGDPMTSWAQATEMTSGAAIEVQVFTSTVPSMVDTGSVVVVDAGPVRVVVAAIGPDAGEVRVPDEGARVYSLAAARRRRLERVR